MRAGKLPAQQDGYLLQGAEYYQGYVERVKSGAPPLSCCFCYDVLSSGTLSRCGCVYHDSCLEVQKEEGGICADCDEVL